MFKWLGKRVVAHCVIVALFTLPVFLLSIPTDLTNDKSIYYKSQILFWLYTESSAVELAAQDRWIRLGRAAPVNPEIVFLAIDQASTSTYLDSELDPAQIAASPGLTLMHSRYPYPRDVYALAADRLLKAGARVVAIDVLFLGPSENDEALKNALATYHDKLVVGMNLNFDPLRVNGKAPSLTLPSASVFPEQDPFDERVGYVNYRPDLDGIVRNVQYRSNMDAFNGNAGADKKPKFYSLAARTVAKAGHPDLVPDDIKTRTMLYAGSPTATFRNYSLYKIFESHAWEKDFQSGEFFRDKIVVIGPQGDFAKDKSMTPYGEMDGAEIHLNAINSLLENAYLQRASAPLILFLTVGAGLLALALALTLIGIGWRFFAGLGVIAGYVITLVWLYDSLGWLLPTTGPAVVFCGSIGVGFIYDFVLNQIEKLRLRTTFERYNSKNVVRYLLDHTEAYEKMLAGTRKPITVLFSDIRSFTSIVETTPDPQQIVDKLNEYFTAMVDCVFRYDGSLDKFMGDGVMAIWGNTPYNFGPEGDAVRAVRSALAMVEELKRLNAKWVSEGKTEWHIGIGLNHGQVIVGDMGSQQHKEFGVVGDAINLGSRLEGLTKQYRLQIILGERVAELVREHFVLRSVDIVQVKGKAKAVQAFTVVAEKSVVLAAEQRKFLSLYEEGISAFRLRLFDRAHQLFELALQIQPDDHLAKDYLVSTTAFMKNPPDAEWTGIRVMKDK